MDKVLQFLSDYAVSLSYKKLSSEAIRQTKRTVIDTLGCMIASFPEEPPTIARTHASEVTSKPGATVIGTRHRTSPELAAFANGVMARYLDFNDTISGHPSTQIPAVLAAAEYASADIETAMSGIVLAYEVQQRIVEGTKRRPVVAGQPMMRFDHCVSMCVSSAAGAGKALGLTKDQMYNALALAATTSVALGQTRRGSLSMWKGSAEGNACRNGVFAAMIARQGMTGPEEAFTGSAGYEANVSGPLEFKPFGGKGVQYMIEHTRFKYYPSDYETQVAAIPAIELHEVIGKRINEITKVNIDTFAGAIGIAADTRDKWAPKTRETADHSIPFIVALGMMQGPYWFDDFTEEKIHNPKILALMQKIDIKSNEEFDNLAHNPDWGAGPEANPFRIEVILKSGEKFIREIRYGKGHPKNPMSDDEIEAKFRRLTQSSLQPEQVDKVLGKLWQLDKVDDLRKIWRLVELESR